MTNILTPQMLAAIKSRVVLPGNLVTLTTMERDALVSTVEALMTSGPAPKTEGE